MTPPVKQAIDRSSRAGQSQARPALAFIRDDDPTAYRLLAAVVVLVAHILGGARRVRRRHLPARIATARLAIVIYCRHWLIRVLVLAAAGLAVGACQKAVSVGAVNRCGADVEVQADSVRESTTRWITLRAGDRDSVVDVPENAETLYVSVRAPGSETVRSFDVPMTSLGRPPADVDYEAQLVLEGDRCP